MPPLLRRRVEDTSRFLADDDDEEEEGDEDEVVWVWDWVLLLLQRLNT
jgi:hypothetical protein